MTDASQVAASSAGPGTDPPARAGQHGTGPVLNWHYALVSRGHVDRVEARLQNLRAGWARVRFEYCGVCGTDRSHVGGQRPVDFPLPLGHEWVAVVEATGPGVEDVAAGDVVVSDLNFRCGACRQCQAGRSHLC